MELYIEPNKITKNPLNGRFLKGHIPHNKGKKWEDYMDMRKARKMKKCLELGRKQGNSMIAGYNKKAVIGIKDGKIIGVFESSVSAGDKLNLIARNIRHCCAGKRKRCGTIYWFYESDYDKWNELLSDK